MHPGQERYEEGFVDALGYGHLIEPAVDRRTRIADPVAGGLPES